ncbi:MAG: hypothetical protein HY360_11680 [Verrucomicrobia bacterium]|nr:hypothetical protein [Verrucomicrobiota bacterium]
MKLFNKYLIVRSTQTENCHGAFAREILCAEGLMSFATVDVDREWRQQALRRPIAVLHLGVPHCQRALGC